MAVTLVSSGTRQGSLVLGGTTLTFGAIDTSGISWVMNDIDFGGDVMGEMTNREGTHGGWFSDQFLAPRIMTLTVTAWAATQILRDAARTLIRKVVPLSQDALLTITEPTVLQCYVRRSGRLLERRPNKTTVQFVIGLVAADPRLYSYPSTTTSLARTAASGTLVPPFTFPVTFGSHPLAARATVTNAGTLDAPWVATITGPCENPGIEYEGTSYRVTTTGSLPAGQSVVFNSTYLTVVWNGTQIIPDLTSRWFNIPEASTITMRLLDDTVTPTSTGSVTYASAYDR